MKFSLDVVKGRGLPASLQLDAPDVDAARRLATDQGWTVLHIQPASWLNAWAASTSNWRASGFASTRIARATGTSSAALLVLVEQLHALLSAGLSVVEALETLQRGHTGSWQSTIQSLNGLLRQGHSLSAALAQMPAFPELLVALVRSAEQTSNLPQALARFMEHEERAAKVRHQVTSVALYPALLMLVGGAVMGFLLLYVMPRFARVFENMSNLPWSAELMVSWARLLHQHGGVLLLVTGLVSGALVLTLASPAQRARGLAALLRVGPLATWMKTYYLARWYRTIGMLVEGGIPLPEALDLSQTVLPLALRGAAQGTATAMRHGQPPSFAFMQTAMATPVAEQLIKAGERSGDVGDMLQRAAHFHETEVTKALDKGMRVIEPLVMTVIGVGVGVIVILMYLPIFELAAAIQ